MELIKLFNQLSIKVKKYKPVLGGDINKAYFLDAEEAHFFIKINDAEKYLYMLEEEAKGLVFLAETGKIHTPKIIEVGEFESQQYLLLEWIEKGKSNDKTWIEFGHSLAEMHKTVQPYFGFEEDNYIGSLKQLNTKSSTWQELYGQYHILPLVKILTDQNKISQKEVKKAENFSIKIKEIFPSEPPSLLHGDLWSGNYITSDKGKILLIDPAVYYGHREMDLGMSKLFGGFSSHFYNSYSEYYPLEKNWQKRLPYTQLYPLLVHAILFGGYYITEVKSILKEF